METLKLFLVFFHLIFLEESFLGKNRFELLNFLKPFSLNKIQKQYTFLEVSSASSLLEESAPETSSFDIATAFSLAPEAYDTPICSEEYYVNEMRTNEALKKGNRTLLEIKAICSSPHSTDAKQEALLLRIYDLWEMSNSQRSMETHFGFGDFLIPIIIFNIESSLVPREEAIASSVSDATLVLLENLIRFEHSISPLETAEDTFPCGIRDIYNALLCVFSNRFLDSTSSVDSLHPYINTPPKSQIDVGRFVIEKEVRDLTTSILQEACAFDKDFTSRREQAINLLDRLKKYADLSSSSHSKIYFHSEGEVYLQMLYSAVLPTSLYSPSENPSGLVLDNTWSLQQIQEALNKRHLLVSPHSLLESLKFWLQISTQPTKQEPWPRWARDIFEALTCLSEEKYAVSPLIIHN